jgi:hypothetical protein
MTEFPVVAPRFGPLTGSGRNPRFRCEMDETDFEGSLVLEQLAAIDKIDDFFEAIDADDVRRAIALMREAGIDSSTIAIVVRKMEESDGQH